MSTICKYFLTNSCRYGDRCRYSHVIPTNDKYSNPYVYDARDKGVSIMQRLSSAPTTPRSVQNNDSTDKVLQECFKIIAEEVNQIELHHMWPLTCYSYLKTGKNFPGWNDISMEEVRWEAYQAQANGTFQVYLSNIQELLSNAKELRNKLLKPNKETEVLIRDLMKDNNNQPLATASQTGPFLMNVPPSQAQANFSFASAFNNKTQESVFNQVTPTSNNSGVFGQALQSNQSSAVQQNSFFGGQSSFSTAPVSNLFKSSSGHQSFSNVEMTTNDAFSSSGSPFHYFAPQEIPQAVHSVSDVNTLLYSKIENLTKEDHEAFKATTFTLDNLPLVPPPKELCK